MRVVVFGAGSVGCQLGARLAVGDGEVVLVGRAAPMAVVAAEGLTLTASGSEPLRVPPGRLGTATDAAAAADADVVLVTVKSGGTAQAARELAPHLRPDQVVVSFQNGLRNRDLLAEHLPPGTPVLAGMVPYNVLRTGPNTVHQGTAGTLMLADDPAGAPLVAALRAAGVSVHTRPDMPGVQAAKLLLNLNNAVNALSGLPLQRQLGLRGYRLVLAACQREALRAFRAEGLRPSRLGPVPPALAARLLRLPDRAFRPLAARTVAPDATARSSMWEDLRVGRRTEVDVLQGEVTAMAARHGLPAPVNAALAALVHTAEAAGPEALPAYSPDALHAALAATTAPAVARAA